MANVRSILSVCSASMMGAVVLTGCGGGGESQEVVGTANPSASSTESRGEEPTASATKDSGEYVPATPEHPAKNVPVPVMPEAAKEESFEGAKAFMGYWTDCVNYLIDSGVGECLQKITAKDSTLMDSVIHDYQAEYSKGNWSVGVRLETEVEDQNIAQISDERYGIYIKQKRTSGKFYGPTASDDVIPEQNFGGEPVEAVLEYKSGGWKFVDLHKIKGVVYEK